MLFTNLKKRRMTGISSLDKKKSLIHAKMIISQTIHGFYSKFH